jgi:NodT family efflux transporter outer membrane factor (OMF) lipoprotein
MTRPALLGGACAALLAGCVVGPRYVTPTPPPTATAGFVSAQSTPALSETPLPAHWWRLYQDPALDELVQRALTQNDDLKTAEANLIYAQGLLREARDGRFPTTNLSAGADYGRETLPTGLTAKSRTYELAGFNAAYQLDIFGQITRAIQAARATAEAQAAARDVVRVTVAAQTASAYANICGYGEQLAAARDSLAIVQKTYDLTVTERDAGALSDFDVSREKVILEQTRAQIAPLEGDRRANLFVLAALVGETPAHIPAAAASCQAPPHLAEPLPVGDGAALIRRRPDVRQAERNLASATAKIGVATAQLYPTVSLGGGISSGALTPAGLGNISNATYSVGPLVSWTFPNVLTARDHIREAGAQAQAALASFDGTVLTALSDTEQALATYGAELDHHVALAAAQQAANEALASAQTQFKDGAFSFLDLLTAQSTAVSANQALAASDQTLAADQIAVFQALGGGWEDAPKVEVPALPRATSRSRAE